MFAPIALHHGAQTGRRQVVVLRPVEAQRIRAHQLEGALQSIAPGIRQAVRIYALMCFGNIKHVVHPRIKNVQQEPDCSLFLLKTCVKSVFALPPVPQQTSRRH